MKKVGGFTTPFNDAIVPAPSPKSGAGSFGDTIGGQGPTDSPIKPVLFADVSVKPGNQDFGPGKADAKTLKG